MYICINLIVFVQLHPFVIYISVHTHKFTCKFIHCTFIYMYIYTCMIYIVICFWICMYIHTSVFRYTQVLCKVFQQHQLLMQYTTTHTRVNKWVYLYMHVSYIYMHVSKYTSECNYTHIVPVTQDFTMHKCTHNVQVYMDLVHIFMLIHIYIFMKIYVCTHI